MADNKQRQQEQAHFNYIGEKMYDDMCQIFFKKMHEDMEADKKKRFSDFHELLNEVVDIVKRNVSHPDDPTIYTEYYRKVLKIAEEMNTHALFFCRSTGGIDWFHRFVRMRPKMCTNSAFAVISPEAAELEKELVSVVDEVIEKHSPLYDSEQRSKAKYYPGIIPIEFHSSKPIVAALISLMKTAQQSKDLIERIEFQRPVAYFILHYQEEFQVVGKMDLPENLFKISNNPFNNFIHGISLIQESYKKTLLNIIDNPESTEDDREWCNSHLKYIYEFNRVFAKASESNKKKTNIIKI